MKERAISLSICGWKTMTKRKKTQLWTVIRDLFSNSCAGLCLVTLSCQTLCNPMDCRPPGSSMGFPRQEYRVAISLSRRSFRPRNRTWVFLHCRQILYQLRYKAIQQFIICTNYWFTLLLTLDYFLFSRIFLGKIRFAHINGCNEML